MKQCRLCHETKPFEDFYNKVKRDGSIVKEARCKSCVSKVKAERHDPIKHRERNLRKKFGISSEQYNEMLSAQNSKCAICGTDNFQFSHGKRAHVDHCHDTGLIRGLLCGKCNVGIGHLNHDISRLEQAILYLKKHAT